MYLPLKTDLLQFLKIIHMDFGSVTSIIQIFLFKIFYLFRQLFTIFLIKTSFNYVKSNR